MFLTSQFYAGAEPERVKREIEEVVGIDCSNAIMVSAKQVNLKIPSRVLR